MWYARTSARRRAQILSDVAVALWSVLWLLAGRWTHDLVAGLADPARALQANGVDLEQSLRQTQQQVADIPLVGERLVDPLSRLAGIGGTVASTGGQLAATLVLLAEILGVVVAVVPIVAAVVPWAVVRLRFYARSAAALRLASSEDATDLFALRALARQPVERLARIAPDPAASWRAGDPVVLGRLAALELRDCGLDPRHLSGLTPRER